MPDLSLITTILIVGINSVILFLTLFSNYKKSINLRFVFWLSGVIFWDTSLYFFYNSPESSLLLIGRLNFISALLVAYGGISFVSIFPENKDLIHKRIRILLSLVTAFIISLTLFTNLISVAEIKTGDEIVTEYGILYFLYVIYLVFYFSLTGYILLYKYIHLTEKRKIQIKSFALTLIIAILWGVLTNVFLPLFGYYNLQPLGPIFTLLFSAYVFYAIIKYQFLDIRILLGRLFYFALIGAIFLSTYYGIYFFDEAVFGGGTTTGAILTGPINAVIFAIFFAKFNDFLRTQVRSRIINPGYDPLVITDQLSRKTATILDIKEIAEETLEAFGQTIRAKYAGIIINPNEYTHNKYLKFENKNIEFQSNFNEKILAIWKKSEHYPIVLDELQFETPKQFAQCLEELEEAKKYMEETGLSVVVPLKQNEKVMGIIFLGNKEAGNMYTNQDIDFVMGVSATVGLAITRSLYHLEVEDLNKNLLKKIQAATKELEEKNKNLAVAYKKLEETRRREKDMVDIMGHELRTPITIVRNAMIHLQGQIRRGEVSKRTLLSYIEKAIESARREINLVETLLSATKVDANRLQLYLTKIDMLDVIHDSIDAHSTFAKEKGIKIKYEKPKEEYWGYADRTRTQEIMDNLLSNAVKYTPKGYVQITITQDNKNVSIAVKDTGIGIHKDDIKRLGKKFFRARQYSKNQKTEGEETKKLTDKKGKVVRPGGTGLGLYVVYNLIPLMDGKIDLKSTYGKGTTFTVTLPKYKDQEPEHIDQTFD